MKITYKGCNRDIAVIDGITSEIATRLVSAEGHQARLLDTTPEIVTYTSSFFLRYPVEIESGKKTHILVKIRRHPKMSTLTEAITATHLHIKMPEEYLALQVTFEYFGQRTDGLSAARPLAYLEDFHALVMLEFSGDTLRQLLMAGARYFAPRAHEERLQMAASRAGRWLRELHFGMNDCAGENYSAKHFNEEIAASFGKLEECGISGNSLERLDNAFDQVIRRLGERHLAICQSHEDFTTDNILISNNDQLAVIDIKIRSAPAYRDLALLLVHPDTYRAQFLTFGAYFSKAKLRAYRNSILDGYFADHPPDRLLLNFYCAKNVLGKWLMYETIMLKHSGVKAAMSSSITPQLRHYYQKNILGYLRSEQD